MQFMIIQTNFIELKFKTITKIKKKFKLICFKTLHGIGKRDINVATFRTKMPKFGSKGKNVR